MKSIMKIALKSIIIILCVLYMATVIYAHVINDARDGIRRVNNQDGFLSRSAEGFLTIPEAEVIYLYGAQFNGNTQFSPYKGFINKFNGKGELIQSMTYLEGNDKIINLAEADGYLYAISTSIQMPDEFASENIIPNDNINFLKLDKNDLSIISQKELKGKTKNWPRHVFAYENGLIMMSRDAYIMQIDFEGNVINYIDVLEKLNLSLGILGSTTMKYHEGRIYICGSARKAGFIACLNENLDIIWLKEEKTNQYLDLIIKNDTIYAVGSNGDSGVVIEHTIDAVVPLIIKYDLDGNVLGEYLYGNKNKQAQFIKIIEYDNNLLVFGRFINIDKTDKNYNVSGKFDFENEEYNVHILNRNNTYFNWNWDIDTIGNRVIQPIRRFLSNSTERIKIYDNIDSYLCTNKFLYTMRQFDSLPTVITTVAGLLLIIITTCYYSYIKKIFIRIANKKNDNPVI